MLQEDTTPNRIKQLRKQVPLTQAQLASKLGVSRAAVSQFETGDSKPSLSTLMKLAEVLGVSINDLVSITYQSPDDKESNSSSTVGFNSISHPIEVHLPLVSTQSRAHFLSLDITPALKGSDTLALSVTSNEEANRYAEALVIEVAEDQMEPLLHVGDKVIAWPVPEAKWVHVYNQVCLVAFDETVTIKAVRENELPTRSLLTLYAQNPAAGFLSVQQEQIKGIWRVEEFFERPKIRL
jgi:transcriptional regulator with XRE-family HTH domain